MKTLTKQTNDKPAAAAERVAFVAPVVNIHGGSDGYRLEVEMPGVDKDGVAVTVEEGQLTIVGHRRRSEETGRVVHRERSQADYRRVFDLDPGIDPDRVSAKFDQGLLEVHLAKQESLKPRKIKVA